MNNLPLDDEEQNDRPASEKRTINTDPPRKEMAGKLRLWLEQERILDKVLERKDSAFHYLVL